MAAQEGVLPSGAVGSVTIDAASVQGALMNPTAYGNFGWLAYQQGLYTAADQATMNTLGLKCVRAFLKVELIGSNYASVYPYLDAASKLSKGADGVTGTLDGCLLLSFNGEASVGAAEGGTCATGCISQAQYSAQLQGILGNLKARYHGIQYIEVLNETDGTVPSIGDYYKFYRSTYQAVNAVNALALPGPEMVPGGATAIDFSTRNLDFLTQYRQDADPAKKLGFVSHHMYWHQTNPIQTASFRPKLDTWLQNLGLDHTVPQFVDELGTSPNNPALDPDYLANAAGTFAQSYYYAQSSPTKTNGGNDFTAAWEIEGKGRGNASVVADGSCVPRNARAARHVSQDGFADDRSGAYRVDTVNRFGRLEWTRRELSREHERHRHRQRLVRQLSKLRNGRA